jgi:predicted nuclease of predicted toxin-antitoxin system
MMKLIDFSFFTDENIDPLLVKFLREKGFDVFDAKENELFGSSDAFLLDLAKKDNRVFITLDSDFGTLVHKDKLSFIGLIFLRPGHFDSSYHIKTLQVILNLNPDVEIPYMIIAEWANTGIKIRIKNAIES